MNPFNLTGWETVVATAIACSTAVACTILGGRVVIQTTQAICQAVVLGMEAFRDAIKDVADAYYNAHTGKTR